MNEMDEKIRLIKDSITEEECRFICDDELFDCAACSCFNECYMKAEIKSDSDFAVSIGCGGYNTEDDFWEQIYQQR